jgi:hypothetical protein
MVSSTLCLQNNGAGRYVRQVKQSCYFAGSSCRSSDTVYFRQTFLIGTTPVHLKHWSLLPVLRFDSSTFWLKLHEWAFGIAGQEETPVTSLH